MVEGGVVELGVEGGVVDHVKASMEVKLKHWNQVSMDWKPAVWRRWWWVCRVSGMRTFSRAVRFWLISRSE